MFLKLLALPIIHCCMTHATLMSTLTKRGYSILLRILKYATSAQLHLFATWKDTEILLSLYDLDIICLLINPSELSGDRKPEYNCADCTSHSQVFNFLDPDLVDVNGELFCHAAVTSIGDLEVLQAAGIHCNKTILGNVLFKSKEIFVLMLKVKLSRIYKEQLYRLHPKSQCYQFIGENNTVGVDTSLIMNPLIGI
jgi:hypothetical protein